jgi:hypothetical protein
MTPVRTRQCPGCKIILPYQDGLEHLLNAGIGRYGIASPECLTLLQQVTLKDYECGGHASVDAYAVQHPPHASTQQILGISPRLIAASKQSVAIHLLGLYLRIEKKMSKQAAGIAMQKVLESGAQLENEQLVPPANLGDITVVDVAQATTCNEHLKLTEEWSKSACKAWAVYYPQVQEWYEKYGKT